MKSLFRGIIFGFLGRGVSLVTPLVVMGPMLNHVGDEIFGIWLTAVSVAAMATFLGFGINNALLTRLSESFGRYDLDQVRRSLGQGYLLSCLISIGLILTMLIIILIATFTTWPDNEVKSSAAIAGIVFFALFVSFPTQILGRLLQANKKFFLAHSFQASGSVIALGCTLIAIKCDASPVRVFLLYSLTPIIVQVLWSIVYYLNHHQLRPMFAKSDVQHWASLLRLGGEFFIVSILVTFAMNIDNAIIAFKFGPEVVTEYGVPARLGSLLMMLVLTVFNPLWPIYAEALARNDKQWILTASRRFGMSMGLVVLFVGSSMAYLADPIMNIWMGRTFNDQQNILLAMTALAIVIGATSPHSMLLNAAGMARQQILPWSIFLAVSVSVKMTTLTDENIWLMPLISAISYICIITPIIIWHSSKLLRG